MTDPSPDSTGSQSPSNSSSGGKRQAILLVLLGIMVVALGYDYMVARPAVSEAYDQIAAASSKANQTAGDVLTKSDVKEILGKEPAETFMDGDQSVDVYHWTGGLIVKPHKLFTTFKRNGDGWMFQRHAKFVYESTSEVAPHRKTVVERGDSEIVDESESEMASRSNDRSQPANETVADTEGKTSDATNDYTATDPSTSDAQSAGEPAASIDE